MQGKKKKQGWKKAQLGLLLAAYQTATVQLVRMHVAHCFYNNLQPLHKLFKGIILFLKNLWILVCSVLEHCGARVLKSTLNSSHFISRVVGVTVVESRPCDPMAGPTNVRKYVTLLALSTLEYMVKAA